MKLDADYQTTILVADCLPTDRLDARRQLVPHYGPGPSGLRALPFLPDLSPHLGEALVELGGPYGSAQRQCAEDGGGDGGVSASANFLQGSAATEGSAQMLTNCCKTCQRKI